MNERDSEDDDAEYADVPNVSSSRQQVLSVIDSFIEQILQIRRTLLGVSISSLILDSTCNRTFNILVTTSLFFCYFGNRERVWFDPQHPARICHYYFIFMVDCRYQAVSFSRFLEQEI